MKISSSSQQRIDVAIYLETDMMDLEMDTMGKTS